MFDKEKVKICEEKTKLWTFSNTNIILKNKKKHGFELLPKFIGQGRTFLIGTLHTIKTNNGQAHIWSLLGEREIINKFN